MARTPAEIVDTPVMKSLRAVTEVDELLNELGGRIRSLREGLWEEAYLENHPITQISGVSYPDRGRHTTQIYRTLNNRGYDTRSSRNRLDTPVKPRDLDPRIAEEIKLMMLLKEPLVAVLEQLTDEDDTAD